MENKTNLPKTRTFTFEGRDYTLEFTARTCEIAYTKYDLRIEDGASAIFRLPTLFKCALLKNHADVSNALVERMLDALGNKAELAGKLAEMYLAPAMSLVEESKNEEEGNAISWNASF